MFGENYITSKSRLGYLQNELPLLQNKLLRSFYKSFIVCYQYCKIVLRYITILHYFEISKGAAPEDGTFALQRKIGKITVIERMNKSALSL